jgi:nucleotide sugar dehydrogenase
VKVKVKEGVQWLMLPPDASLHQVLQRQAGAAERGLPAGIALIVDQRGGLMGTITDGDVRRAILRTSSLELHAAEIMRRDPILFPEGTSFQDILEVLPSELAKRNIGSRRFLGKIILVDSDSRPTRVLDYHQLWEQRVATHRHVVVLGMGYVGLTLALGFAEEGFHVTGVDTDPRIVEMLGRRESRVHEVGLPELLREQLDNRFFVSHSIPLGGDVFVISVGTPVKPNASGGPVPNLSYLQQAAEMVGEHLMPNGLVVLRSTVPVGATREVVLPILERESGLTAGRDFHLAFAPERTTEGNALKELRTLPQIIGGLNQDSVEATTALFRELAPDIVRVESLEAAEMAKLVNNSFRDLIFAFANQVAQLAVPFNLSASDVIRAANRGYPRDPIPVPSPGVGGACLTKDPYILASVACRAELDDTLFTLGRRVNERMLDIVADSVVHKLLELDKDPRLALVLLCGLAFKGNPETADLRNSTSIDIARRLHGRVGKLFGHDPVVPAEDIAAEGIEPVSLPDGFAGMDAVLFLNNHPSYRRIDVFSMTRALAPPGIVYDGWDLFRAEDVTGTSPSVYLGLSYSRSSADLPIHTEKR